MSFFQKNKFLIFLFSQPLGLWVSTRPPCHCGRVSTQHEGIQSGFRCLRTHQFFFGNFQEKIKCQNSAKNGQKCPKSKSPLIIFKYLFSLQISAHLAFKWPRKSKMFTFLPKSGLFGFSQSFKGQMS